MSHIIGRGRYAREAYPQSPGAGGFGEGWIDLFDIDLAALAAQTLTGGNLSGPFDIGGLPFYKVFPFGSPGEQTDPVIVPGEGLILSPDSTTEWFAIPLGQFPFLPTPGIVPVPLQYTGVPMRLLSYLGDSTPDTGNVGFDAGFSNIFSGDVVDTFISINDEALFMEDFVQNGHSLNGSPLFEVVQPQDSILMTETNLASFGTRAWAGVATVAGSGQFPTNENTPNPIDATVPSFQHQASLLPAGSATHPFTITGFNGDFFTSWMAGFGGFVNPNEGGSASITIRRIKMQIYRSWSPL